MVQFAVALTSLCLSAVALLAGPDFAGTASLNWPLRAALIAAAALLAAGTLIGRWRNLAARERALQDLLRRLAAFDPAQESETPVADFSFGTPPDQDWSAPCQALLANFRQLATRVQSLEAERTTLAQRVEVSESQVEQARAILTGVSEPVIAVNAAGHVMLANASAKRLLDLPGEIGSDCGTPLELLANCEQLIGLLTETRVQPSGTERTADVEIADEHGQSHWYSVTTRALATATVAGGSPAAQGAVAVLRDISVQKTIQRRNAEFVSAVSHEMKTPLAGIKAYVELLADGDAEDSATQEEFLSVINGQTNRLQRLVDNMLNLARIEAGMVHISRQPCQLEALLGEAISLAQPAAEQKGIELRAELTGQDLSVLADGDMLLEAAVNLVSNAVKYTPPGGQAVVRSRCCGQQVQFEVADTGVGLAPDDCQKVFEKFYRVQKDKMMATGTGLGLPLAKHIVEDLHGGRLSVTSNLGQGSTFTVTLPVAEQPS